MQKHIDEWRLNLELEQVFDQISHARVKKWRRQLDVRSACLEPGDSELTRDLLAFTGFRKFVGLYKTVSRQIFQALQ